MKNLKKYFSVLIVALLLTIATISNAYEGGVTFDDRILMPSEMKDGKAEITVTRDIQNYTMYYEFVKMDNNTYKEIVQLKDELQVAEYFNIWENLNGETEDQDYEKYIQAYDAYKAKYGTTVDDFSDNRIDEVESQIVSLWPSYTNNWTTASGNIASIDLNSFKGVEDYTLWIKVNDKNTNREYLFADVYELTGTKKDEPKKEENNTNTNNTPANNTPANNTPANNTPANNTPANNTPVNNTPSNNNTVKNNTTKNNTTKPSNDSTISAKTLPKTGINNVIIGLVVMAAIAAGVSYIKYRKIK